MSVALPLLFVFAPLCRGYFLIWLHLLVLAVGVLFITDFRFRKPTNKELAVLVAVVGVAVLRGLLIWKEEERFETLRLSLPKTGEKSSKA